jgi:hypothetical protein
MPAEISQGISPKEKEFKENGKIQKLTLKTGIGGLFPHFSLHHFGSDFIFLFSRWLTCCAP